MAPLYGILWVFGLLVTITCKPLSPFPKLLLISFDGFRYDLINKDLVPTIYKWANEEATWFKNGIKSQYITYTAPNHMSIVSGLYQESHGIVSNYFYDTELEQKFDYFNMTLQQGIINASMAPVWYKADPIWLTNQRAGSKRRSASWYWPMGEVPYPYEPKTITFGKQWSEYRNLTQWMTDVDSVLNFFTDTDEPYNFVAWYVEEPDHTLHKNGFNNGKLTKKLTELDKLFEYLLQRMKTLGLDKDVNLVLISDHGHAEIIDERHVFCIPDHINMTSGFELGDHMIYPKDEEHAIEIFNNLTAAIKKGNYNVTVQWKKDFPLELHYKNSSRVGRILLDAEIGSALSFSCNQKKLEETYGMNGKVKFNSSTHGMDPTKAEMHGILVMQGPAFESGVKIKEIPENVDVYALMCEVLDIKPSPNNGSSKSVVFDALVSRTNKLSETYSSKEETTSSEHLDDHGIVNRPEDKLRDYATDSLAFLFILGPAMCVVGAFFCYGCRNAICKDDPAWALKRGGYRPLDTNRIQLDVDEGLDERTVESGNTKRLTNGTSSGLGSRSRVEMSTLLLSEDSDENEL